MDEKFLDAEGSVIASDGAKGDGNSVAILLSYFNGKSYIEEQLESIFSQTHELFHIFLCDDNSSNPFSFEQLDLDTTLADKMSICFRKKNLGFQNNFIETLKSIEDDFNYFAFSDQDDIWRPKKLEKALKSLESFSPDIPLLYCARTELVDEKCEKIIGLSPYFKEKPSFSNSLVQNIAGGNTMVFNKSAKDLIVKSTDNVKVVSHDWWAYQIITGAGGVVVYDPEPCLKYRQHATNLVGQNLGFKAQFLRARLILKGRFKKWNQTNINSLIANKELLTRKNLEKVQDFEMARESGFFKRLIWFLRADVRRQTLTGNIGLFIGILLNKV